MRKFYALFLAVVVLCTSTIYSQQYVNYALVPGAVGLQAPVEVVNAGDGTNRLFIVQQNGVIRIYETGTGLRTDTFLFIRHRIAFGGEEGLLSLAFHPAYETNGYFYIYYNNLNGDITVARYQVSANPNRADSLSGVSILDIAHPTNSNHNGGHLQFDTDSTLYFATGDGGSGNDPPGNAQNTLSRLGKMLRLKVYTDPGPPYFEAPDNNPFIGNASYDSLIWAYGLRNPFRWSFDRLTGDMWIGDVGQGAKEEVNFRAGSSTGGENYGWRCYEGSIRTPGVPACDPPNYFPPIFDYNNPASGSSSVVGGYVYRGNQYPSLYGYYITSDVYTDSIYLIKPNGSGGWKILRDKSLFNFVVSFGEGEDGKLYAVSQGTGSIYEVLPSATLAVSLGNFFAKHTSTGNEIKWNTVNEEGIAKFIVEYSFHGNNFIKAGEVTANGNADGSSYSFMHQLSDNKTAVFYRLAIIEANNSIRYSVVVKIDKRGGGYQIYPTLVRDGKLYVNTDDNVRKIQVLNRNGSLVYEKKLQAPAGQITVQLPPLSKGLYVVRLVGNSVYSEKIILE
jgi:glucose/arabinose dehydrogenase